ncbi:MAG: Gfo/Idh/MocA family oxidoreductase [Phycisphaerales bacterium]|nr:Gfo/Idh/MocA family oxidoreductase [Phycisphaerales bacterium]
MLRIGVIGCGMIAELGHLPAIAEVPGLQVYALYDRDFERARELQRRFHAAHAYPTEEEFYRSNIDAVVVCTPAPIHHKNVCDAAEHGKPVLCEKPLGTDEAQMREMKRIMEEAGLPLYTGFNYRFSESARTIRNLVREKAVGEVRLLRLVYNWGLHGRWRWDENGVRINSPLRTGRMEEGGPLVDCGVHQIDLARWWLGSEVEWQRGIGVWLDDYEAPDHVYLHMGHGCGAHTMVEVSFSYNATSREPRSHFMYEIIGTDGVIRYNREEHSFEVRNSHGTQHLPWHPEKSFAGMYHEFARSLRDGTAGDMPTADDGIAATRIAWEATEQAVRDRDRPSEEHACTLIRGERVDAMLHRVPMDTLDPVRPE